MPPRLQCPKAAASLIQQSQHSIRSQQYLIPVLGAVTSAPADLAAPARRRYATAASLAKVAGLQLPANYVPPTQPPSARRPDTRKSQLLRAYTALLRSTPLTLVFQHNSLTSQEWAAVRRELRTALASVPAPPAVEGGPAPVDITEHVKLQVVRTRILDQALKIVEFFDPNSQTSGTATEAALKGGYTHDLSMAVYKQVSAVDVDNLPADSMYGQLGPLLVGPVALLTFPAVSPAHLAAALSILAPSPPAFPAPTRRKNPGYYDLTTQSALHKLLLVGGRVEDRVFDNDGVRWIGGIEGGRDGLRAQLVHMLQSAGLGLTSALEGTGKSVWLALEGRRTMLEDEAKGPEEAKKEGEA
ncbi:hypothetical protein RB594_005467 [Gaeumannomyces avenae]